MTDAIGFDAIVGADRITVDVRDNDVTLTGTVRSSEHRAAALAAAANVPGSSKCTTRSQSAPTPERRPRIWADAASSSAPA